MFLRKIHCCPDAKRLVFSVEKLQNSKKLVLVYRQIFQIVVL